MMRTSDIAVKEEIAAILFRPMRILPKNGDLGGYRCKCRGWGKTACRRVWRQAVHAAVRICGNDCDAEALVFRTLSHSIAKIGQYGKRSSFFSWLYSILANFHRMDMRKKGATAIVFCDELPEREDFAPNPAERLAFDTEAEIVREATAQLPEPLREIIVLRYFEDLSLREISTLLKLPLSTVKFRLHFAKRKLRAKLKLSFHGETAYYGGQTST